MKLKILKKIGFWILGFLVALLSIFLLFLFKKVSIEELQVDPKPLKSFKEAERHISGLKSLDDDSVNELCRTRFFSHNKQTERAVILYHDYTSCPNQFENLGKVLYDRGYNVLIPRLPYHGLKDRLNDNIDNLTKKELVLFTNETVDIAQGLGINTDVIGFSGGGVLASWAVQNREDLSKVMIISPYMANQDVSSDFLVPLSRLYSLSPKYFMWWDKNKGEYAEIPEYSYPRYSFKSIGQFFYLGGAVLKLSENTVPHAQSVIVVTNENEKRVNNNLADELVSNWKKSGATNVHTYSFEKIHNLGHDIIDPNDLYAKPRIVYSEIINLLYGDMKSM